MDIDKNKPVLEHLKRHVDNIAYDMRDDRFDGWTQEHFRNNLRQLRDHINKALEE